MDPQRVKNLLIAAREAVEGAEIPDPLLSIAFLKAVDLLSDGAKDPDAEVQQKRTAEMEATTQTDSPLDTIATKLELNVDIVRGVFDERDGVVHIIVPGQKRESTKRGATQKLALLTAAGNQGAELEDSTPVSAIREVAEEYKNYDRPNFARHINDMHVEFRFPGKGLESTCEIKPSGLGQGEGADTRVWWLRLSDRIPVLAMELMPVRDQVSAPGSLDPSMGAA